MSITVTQPSYDKVYTMYAWRDNNIRLVLTQGEGASSYTDNAVVNCVKAPMFQLRDDRGVIDLTSCTVALALTRPDGSEDLLACNIASGDAVNGIISCPITASATAIAGQATGEIRVVSGNGIIKFFGVHAMIYKGVSDAAAEHSTRFSDLIKALQKVVAITPDGSGTSYVVNLDETIEENGTNPVASGVIYDALEILNTKNTQQDNEIANKVSFEDCTASGKTADECIDGSTLYKIKLTTGIVSDNTTSILICVPSELKLVQYAFTRGGSIAYRSVAASHNIPVSGESWTSWSYIPTYQKVVDMILRNVNELESVDYSLYDTENKTDLYTYMSQSAYSDYNTSAPYSSTKVPSSDAFDEDEESDKSQPAPIQLPSGAKRISIRDTATGEEWIETGINSGYKIKNLIPNRKYVYVAFNSTGDVVQSGICQANGQVRMIDATCGTSEKAPFNVRDLGGWSCNGGKLKYGLVYRGSELNIHTELTNKQIKFLKYDLGIRDEIDLRGCSSADNDATNNIYVSDITESALGLGVGYERKSVRYQQYSFSDGALYAALIKRVAKNIKENKPMYIHCTSGADRTAQLCMLIEAICGVSQSDMDRDYELTAFSKKSYSPYARNYRYRYSGTNGTWKDWMLEFGKAEHGLSGTTFNEKVIDYLVKSGVTVDEINEIRFGLIDGTPTKIANQYGDASITKTLTNVTIDNASNATALYQPFEANVAADDMFEITQVTLTMDGDDAISYYQNGKISIPIVTGDIVITATASQSEIISELIANSSPIKKTVTIYKNYWVGNTYNITAMMPPVANADTLVNIALSETAYTQLVADGCGGLYVTTDTSNNVTTFTLHAIENPPTENIAVQLTMQQLRS